MTQAGKKKKRAANRSILLAKKIIIKDGGTVSGLWKRVGGGRGSGDRLRIFARCLLRGKGKETCRMFTCLNAYFSNSSEFELH